MESNERNLFLRLERQLYVDLKDWRQAVVRQTRTHYDELEEEIHRQIGGLVDLDSARAEVSISGSLTDYINDQLSHIKPEIHENDLICVAGDILYEEGESPEDSPALRRLGNDTQLRGKFQYIEVKPYYDEKLLDIPDGRVTQNIIEVSRRKYGPHMVLGELCEIGVDGSMKYRDRHDVAYIPLMYRRLDLRGYLLPDDK